MGSFLIIIVIVLLIVSPFKRHFYSEHMHCDPSEKSVHIFITLSEAILLN